MIAREKGLHLAPLKASLRKAGQLKKFVVCGLRVDTKQLNPLLVYSLYSVFKLKHYNSYLSAHLSD
jgi:hypothetical protein